MQCLKYLNVKKLFIIKLYCFIIINKAIIKKVFNLLWWSNCSLCVSTEPLLVLRRV